MAPVVHRSRVLSSASATAWSAMSLASLAFLLAHGWSGWAGVAQGAAPPARNERERYGAYRPAARPGDGVRFGAAGGTAAAASDTFYLYGGPGIFPGTPDFQPEGKFETPQGQADRQGWSGVDLTASVPHWHVSTFQAPALPAAAPGWWHGPWSLPAPNHAMWCGAESGTAGWASAPGYGDRWDDRLDLTLAAPDPQQPATVELALLFNHDTEPGADYFTVEWDSAGCLRTLASFDGSNRDVCGQFTTPVELIRSCTYAPGDYVDGVDLHLRLHFQSDGARSDEDGQFPSDGAVQIDAVQVKVNGTVVSQTGFENGDSGGWASVSALFCGDFSKVLLLLSDLDPCRDNHTPQMTFIDTGAPPNNDPMHRTTGGSRSSTWSYGVPGAWVVNYTGGLSLGEKPLDNEVWSPEIAWQVPGPADDAVNADGALLRFTSWQHLPPTTGIFAVWHVRSRPDPDTGGWTPWRDRAFVYYDVAGFVRGEIPIRDLLVPEPTHLQVALGVVDLADLYGFAGDDATPAPTFDNVAVLKFDAATPTIVGREVDWFQDAFPQSGAVACTGEDDLPLAIRLDMARDIRPANCAANVPGDSIVADFAVCTPGLALDTLSVRLELVLDANPCFAGERAAAVSALQAGAAGGASDLQLIGPHRYRGYVRGRPSSTAGGIRVPGRYCFDLPDGPVTLAGYQTPEPALFFPGDRLRWFFAAATVGGGEQATLPADTSGFTADGSGAYDRAFRVAGLPGLSCGASDADPCTQPLLLVWNDRSARGRTDELEFALDHQHGFAAGGDYDLYATRGAASLISNGLGSAGVHGAVAAQLAGYTSLFYDAADLTHGLLCDGSNTAGNDKSDDVGVLQAWFAQAGDRSAAYWGDNIAWGLSGGGAAYRSSIMHVVPVADDVRGMIGGQTTPRVAATADGTAVGFVVRYLAYGGCLSLNRFDHIDPGTGASKSHEFLSPSGAGGAYAPSAAVFSARTDSIAGRAYRRRNVTFPYGFASIWDVTGGPNTGGDRAARANLLRELIIAFGLSHLLDYRMPDGVHSVPIGRLALRQNHPNPFNPATTIQLQAPARGHLAVRVYNLRGELVATLLEQVVAAGPQQLLWRGVDRRGAQVASGIYVCRAEGFGQIRAIRMALLR